MNAPNDTKITADNCFVSIIILISKHTIIDNAGSFLVLLVHSVGKDRVPVNIYGLNRSDPAFKNIKDRMKGLGKHKIIIVGDWNQMTKPSLDYYK